MLWCAYRWWTVGILSAFSGYLWFISHRDFYKLYQKGHNGQNCFRKVPHQNGHVWERRLYYESVVARILTVVYFMCTSTNLPNFVFIFHLSMMSGKRLGRFKVIFNSAMIACHIYLGARRTKLHYANDYQGNCLHVCICCIFIAQNCLLNWVFTDRWLRHWTFTQWT